MTPIQGRANERILHQTNAIFNQCYFVGVAGTGNHGPHTLAGHSMMVDPEGRILQEAGENEAILTEILDLDLVTRTREFGTHGMGPFLKHLREYGGSFPFYSNIQGEAVFKSLGPLKRFTKLT